MRRTISKNRVWFSLLAAASFSASIFPGNTSIFPGNVAAQDKFDATAVASQGISKLKVKAKDWPQWGGSAERNNVPDSGPLPIAYDVKTGKNIRWSAALGSETYGNPVVANGKAYVGTNNGSGYVKRYPATVDLGCLICFDDSTGKFLWQHSSEKLPTGRVHDWPNQGICCAPLIDGDRLW